MTLKLFALHETHAFAAVVAEALELPLAAHEDRAFEDGEHKARPLESVRGCDVYVVQSLYGEPGCSVNDKLVRLLFFLGALRDAGASRVTAVVPYLCYARKDRRSKPRDPLSSRYVATLLEAVGVDAVITIDVHNLAAYENAFRIHAVHLEARQLLVERCDLSVGDAPLAVVSPDVGGVKRAEAFAASLSARIRRPIGRAFMDKYRSEGVVSGGMLAGDVRGHDVIVVDDLVSSGGTLVRAIEACAARGARRIDCVATHAVFSDKAQALLAHPRLRRLLVTDSVAPSRLRADAPREKLEVVSCAQLFADTIRRMNEHGSVHALLAD